MTAVPRVAVVRCPDYGSASVRSAVGGALDLLGGLEKVLPRRARVFVKINHLSPPSPPGAGIVTHPSLTAAVLERLKDSNAEVVVGDDVHSPDGDGFSLSGYRDLCRRLGLRLVNLREAGFRETFLDGRRLASVHFSPLVLEADAVVNLPKLKTHSFTVFTGAVKNMFGCIPHGRRLEFHRRFSRLDDFAEMLIDIYGLRPPDLTIMDAVVVMEGQGPAGGTLRRAGLVLASSDGVAVDAVATHLAGYDAQAILTTQFAHNRGLGIGDVERIEIVGERPGDVVLAGFKPSSIASGLIRKRLPAALYAFLSGQLIFVPQVDPGRCTGCEECVRSCPTGAARRAGPVVRIERKACIGCMCCHEVCRFSAVRLGRKPLGRVIGSTGRIVKRLGFRI